MFSHKFIDITITCVFYTRQEECSMSVKELEREKVRPADPEKKLKEPPKYQAVFRKSTGRVCICDLNLLTDVFNISSDQAMRHLRNVLDNGRETIMAGNKDLIKTKVDQANLAAQDKKRCSMLGTAYFICEPA